MRILCTALSLSLALLALAQPRQDAPEGAAERSALAEAFRTQGVRVSFEERWCSIPAEICIREDLLEYLLVAPHGASHESLFATGVKPSVLAAALATLGAEPGTNAQWRPRDPPPSDEELARGVFPYVVTPPSGTGFLLYAAWREEGETYFLRVEDLISNLRTGRSMRRHPWVFLGSRMVRPRPGSEEEALAADLEGNVVNLSFFRAGNTLLTAALDDCAFQTIWLPNSFLVPPRGTRVELLFSRERLERVPAALASELPELGAGEVYGEREEREEREDGEDGAR